jgi:hypothetical protein
MLLMADTRLKTRLILCIGSADESSDERSVLENETMYRNERHLSFINKRSL